MSRRSSAPSINSGVVKPFHTVSYQNKDPNNRLTHLKDKNEILASIKKMLLMSKITKIKKIPNKNPLLSNMNFQPENPLTTEQLQIETRETSFETDMLNSEISEIDEK